MAQKRHSIDERLGANKRTKLQEAMVRFFAGTVCQLGSQQFGVHFPLRWQDAGEISLPKCASLSLSVPLEVCATLTTSDTTHACCFSFVLLAGQQAEPDDAAKIAYINNVMRGEHVLNFEKEVPLEDDLTEVVYLYCKTIR